MLKELLSLRIFLHLILLFPPLFMELELMRFIQEQTIF